MKKFFFTALAAAVIPVMAAGQMKVNVNIDSDITDGQTIPKEIYGQFAEHLGSCIYGGLWVGQLSFGRCFGFH